MKEKPRLYSYVRFSSERQATGNSLERQKDSIANMVKQVAIDHDLEIFEEYEDFGVSAFKGKNISEGGALAEFIKHVDSGKVPKGSFLLIESLDRFSRANAMLAVNLFTSLLLKGIVVVTGIDKQVYQQTEVNNDTMQQLMFSVMLFSRANEESSTKSKRTISSALAKIKRHQKRKPGDPVVAITELGTDKFWTDSSSGYVEPHPVFYPIAQHMIQMKRDGWSNRMMLRYLKDNYPAPKKLTKLSKGEWNIQHCSRILSPAIYGQKIISVNEQEFVLDDYYPAIITKAEYEDLSVQVGNRGFTKDKNPDIPLLSGIGILYCGHCGTHMYKMKSSIAKQPNAYRYVCGSRDYHLNCSKWGFRADTLESALLQLIADRVFVQNDKPKHSGVENQISELDEQIANYLVAIGTAKSPAMINNLTALIDKLENEKAELVKQKRLHDESIVRMNLEGWDKFRDFDVSDIYNIERLKIRASIKTVVQRIECKRLPDPKHTLFNVLYRDQRTQRIVIKANTSYKSGCVYVDATTINDRQFMESWGLIMHSFIDVLIDPEGFARKCEELQERVRNTRTIISELEDEDGEPEPRPAFTGIVKPVSVGESFATIDGIQYKVDSMEHLEELLKEKGVLS
ncbi:recombinase family protein [Buttiauxella noackiae]|uniref:recombinase family protein n=1 Tax=Buttiauxella noackiae TaxID=82992 RepID=UPI00068F1444|nr:recombinase family protein [Buttiauxella noackiae]